MVRFNKSQLLQDQLKILLHKLFFNTIFNHTFEINLMGNYFSTFMSRSSETAAGKVILWDGTVQDFTCTLTAAELMLEHPQQVVVEFHAAVKEKKPIPLPADQKLDMKKVYVMLPLKRGKPITTLSSEEARRVLMTANSVLRSKSILSSFRLVPFFARICPANHVQNMGQKLPLQDKENVLQKPEEVRCLTELMPESIEDMPEYLNRQYSGKGWKPSLDTITEKKIGRKVSHWLY